MTLVGLRYLTAVRLCVIWRTAKLKRHTERLRGFLGAYFGSRIRSRGTIRDAFFLREDGDFTLVLSGVSLHRAMAFEQRALMDDEHGRGEVADDTAGWADLDPLGSSDIAVYLARDDNRGSLDLGSDDGAFANDQMIFCSDFTLDGAIEAG